MVNCSDENYPYFAETKTACEAKYDALVNGEYALRGFKKEDLYSDYDNGVCKDEYKNGDECISPYYASNVNKMK